MEQLLTGQFWYDQGAVVTSAPWVIIPLQIKGALDGREIKGLRAENSAAERLLELAHKEQKVVTTQVEILEPTGTKLISEIADVKTEVARIKADLPELVKAQLDKVASTKADSDHIET